MKNSARKAYLLAAFVTVAIIGVAFAVTAASSQGSFSLCGEFCQRLGCNHRVQEPEPSAAQERSDAAQEITGSGSTASAQATLTCQLSKTELGQRMNIVRDLYEGVEDTRELADGYEMTFPGSAAWGRKLFDFVSAERQCCPFFLFELKFEPGEGPIRLSMRGGPEVKDFLESFQSDRFQ